MAISGAMLGAVMGVALLLQMLMLIKNITWLKIALEPLCRTINICFLRNYWHARGV